MNDIILDTNFLLLPAQKKRDIFSLMREQLDFNYHLFVLDKSIDELEKIAAHKSAEGKNAEFTLKLVRSKEALSEIRIISSNGLVNEKSYVDDILSELGKKGFIIATQDRGLRRRVRKSICLSSDKIILNDKRVKE